MEHMLMELPPRELLTACNQQTAPYALSLTPEDLEALSAGRRRALADTGRVELGATILPALVEAFRDSPNLHQDSYPETLLTLQEVFYRYKNEAGERTPDRTVLAVMRRGFDWLGGGAEALACFSMKELLERMKEDGHETN